MGKLDASADRQAGVLHVNALYWDVETSQATVGAVDREIDDLAAWLAWRPVRKSWPRDR